MQKFEDERKEWFWAFFNIYLTPFFLKLHVYVFLENGGNGSEVPTIVIYDIIIIFFNCHCHIQQLLLLHRLFIDMLFYHIQKYERSGIFCVLERMTQVFLLVLKDRYFFTTPYHFKFPNSQWEMWSDENLWGAIMIKIKISPISSSKLYFFALCAHNWKSLLFIDNIYRMNTLGQGT